MVMLVGENKIQIFENSEFGHVRVVIINGEPWLVGKDVAAALGYSDTYGALKKHVDDEDKQNCQNDSFETPRGMTLINESGLYSLILSSKLPTAKNFKRWVTSEVLPSIRKHGGYIAGQESMSGDELMARAVLFAQSKIDELENKTKELEAKIQADAPAVEFAETIANAKNAITFDKFAKALYDNHGIRIGRNQLFKLLRENRILKKDNLPYQKYMQKGWFKVREVSINSYVYSQTLIQGQGQQRLYELIKSIQTKEN